MNTNKLQATFWLALLPILLLGGVAVLLRSVDTAVAGGTTWYVNATAVDDSDTCTSPVTPCATVSGALGKAASGDTIYIASGTYDEAINISQSVTLIGAGNDQTILTNSSGDALHIQDGNGNATRFPVLVQDVAIQGASGMGIMTMEDVTVNRVRLQGNGGQAIYNLGTIMVTNSTVSDHHLGSGGAVMINFGPSRMALVNVTVTDNTSDSSFVHAQNDAHMSLTNVTISGNSGGGEGLVVAGSAVVTVTNSTIAYNAEGVVQYSGQLRMENTVVANNDINCWSTVISLGHNLEDDDSCGFDQSSDIVDTDPKLDLLADNGGDVPTHMPLSESPLIDAGTSKVCPAMDARGETRPFDGDDNGSVLCDIGAVEYINNYPVFLPMIIR